MPGSLPPACQARGKLWIFVRQGANGTLRLDPSGESLIKGLFYSLPCLPSPYWCSPWSTQQGDLRRGSRLQVRSLEQCQGWESVDLGQTEDTQRHDYRYWVPTMPQGLHISHVTYDMPAA